MAIPLFLKSALPDPDGEGKNGPRVQIGVKIVQKGLVG